MIVLIRSNRQNLRLHFQFNQSYVKTIQIYLLRGIKHSRGKSNRKCINLNGYNIAQVASAAAPIGRIVSSYRTAG